MVSQDVKKLLKKHKLKLKDFRAFKEEKYGAFPVDDTTVAQHFIQSKDIKLEFPEYRVRGIRKKIRELVQDEFPVITVAIGPEMVEPRTYAGCKVDGCYAGLKEGNCTKRDDGHGFQGEEGAPIYTTHTYKVSDGPDKRKDSIVAICRHDVNDGQSISGVWKLKGILNDNGEFFCWAGLEVPKEELESWVEDEQSIIVGGEEDVPDLSYLDEEEEAPPKPEDYDEKDPLVVAASKGITPEEAEGGVSPDIVKKFRAIMANEKTLAKTKIKTWLKGKLKGTDVDVDDAFETCIKVADCELVG
ncbi:MAG: hypothetical protein ACE5IO_07115, partial [Thermoplasmata archaeon]